MAVAPFGIPSICAKACFPHFPGNHSRTFLLNPIFLKNQLDQLCPFWIDRNFPIFHVIPQQRRPKYHTPLHLPGLSPLDAGGGFAALLLCNGTHNREPQFRIWIQRIDAVVHKQHPYP